MSAHSKPAEKPSDICQDSCNTVSLYADVPTASCMATKNVRNLGMFTSSHKISSLRSCNPLFVKDKCIERQAIVEGTPET